ncbi:MAG: SPOR domain-containing protein, partial [Muribaculaceae bacterium]|nr:SPOR domain-containing protein [Muribaculaceae bacterium]
PVKIKSFFFQRFGKTAAAVILGLVVACAAFFYPLPSDQREQKASVVPVDALFTKKTETKVATNTVVADSLPSQPVKEIIEPSKPKHYLIVATFVSKAEADTYVAKFSSEEFPLITVSSRKVTRVAAASSDNKAALQAKINSKEITSRFSNPWIWTEVK